MQNSQSLRSVDFVHRNANIETAFYIGWHVMEALLIASNEEFTIPKIFHFLTVNMFKTWARCLAITFSLVPSQASERKTKIFKTILNDCKTQPIKWNERHRKKIGGRMNTTHSTNTHWMKKRFCDTHTEREHFICQHFIYAKWFQCRTF